MTATDPEQLVEASHHSAENTHDSRQNDMPTEPISTDCDGADVRVGDVVEVLSFQAGIFDSMPEGEIPYVKSMLNEKLEVDEIDEKGLAWVWKSWPDTDESCTTHGLGLEPHQMRRVG